MENKDFRTICLIVLALLVAGCGVDWFPQFNGSAVNPTPFSFNSKFGVPIFASVSSNTVTISGFANNSTASPISISAGSAYSINGSTPTTSAGTIKNNQTVKVIQTTSSLPGASTVSTLTIGFLNGTFTTVTQTITTPVFAQIFSPPPKAGFAEISAPISGTDVGGHVVTMAGKNTELAISDANGIITTNFTTSTAPLSVPFLNNQHILLLIPTPAITPKTILTIDNTNFVIDNTSFIVTSSPK